MRSLACVFSLIFLATVGEAQTTATIVGAVTDSSGAVVPNTKITAVHKATGVSRTTLTNTSGGYVLPLLPVGEYSVTAEVNGFKKETVTGVLLQVNQESRVDIALEVGAVTETVSVSAQGQSLQTESAVVGQVVDNRYTTQIPLNGRDFAQLVLLVPGTATRPGGFEQTVGAATGSLGSGVAIGGRDNQNNFTLDGAGNNARQFGNVAVKPSVDAIQEFKVQTNSYSAEMGQAAFGQISLITKSGTNAVRGALFEFWRNNVFDARNFFLPQPSRLNRNQFGGAIGGPIVRNRAFFFANYEGNRERRGVEVTRSVPIQAWREGDFSGVAGLTLRDPQSGQPFPGNRIPTARFSKAAQAALSMWPAVNFGNPATTISNNLLITNPNRYSDDQFTIKSDWEVSAKDRLSGRFTRAAHDQTAVGGLPGFELSIPPVNKVALLSWTRIFNPRLLGEFRTSFTRSEFVQCSPNCYKEGVYAQFGINHPLAGAQFEGAPSFTFSNVTLTTFGDDDFNFQRDISNEFNYAGNLTWTRGAHTLKGGLNLTRYQQNTPGPVTGLRRGSFNFRGDFTGHAFADLLLGYPFTASRVVGNGVETGRSWWHGYFFQDDWRISRRLTLNFGLRYEYISPLVDNLDRRSTFWPLSNDYNRPEAPRWWSPTRSIAPRPRGLAPERRTSSASKGCRAVRCMGPIGTTSRRGSASRSVSTRIP